MLRFIARFLGLWLLAAAVIALVVDGAKTIAAGAIVTTSLGQLWYSVSASTLNAAQAAIQRGVHPLLWDPVIVSVLLSPTFAVAGVVGALLLVAGRKRRRPEAQLDYR